LTDPTALSSTLTVRSLLSEGAGLRLVLLAGEAGLDRRIAVNRIQKPGLALAGFVRQVQPERVQILGATELSYLASFAAPGGATRHRDLHGHRARLYHHHQGARCPG